MRQQKHGGGRRWLALLLVLVLAAGGYTAWALKRPLPLIQPTIVSLPGKSTTSQLNWPGGVQSAVGVVGSNILQTNGPQDPAATASTAKIITALVVLQAKPVKAGEQGPLITLSNADVALYSTYNTAEGSVVPVRAGEQISEYQVLQAMMLPSANNLADSLAIWAFGSLPAYNQAATTWLAQHNLTRTHIGSDASGLNPDTTSTAHDLVLIGELAMQNPVLTQIVGQPTASGIPVAGTIKNVNFLLGSHNIIGIKTGNSDQAGGVYVSASTAMINKKLVTIVTALVGAPSLFAAVNNSLPLIESAQANFQTVTVVKAGTTVGSYHLPWGGNVPALASHDLTTTVWNGSLATAPTIKLPALSPGASGKAIAQLSTAASGENTESSVTINLPAALPKPSPLWRLTHPWL